MSRTRQVGAIDGSGRGCVVTEDTPPLQKGTVLVEVRASLISPGTELQRARQLRKEPDPKMKAPAKFGYQNAGDVLEVGDGVTDLRVGDRVACMGGGYAQHATRAVVPKNLCAKLPDNVSYEEGAFNHLAATSLHAVRRGEPALGERCLVVGLGLVGQMAARLAQIGGMYVMGWDMNPFRCEIARKWGIDDATIIGQEDAAKKAESFTRGLGFDMAVMAFGGEGTEALKAVHDAMKLTPDGHRMGRISLVGGVRAECFWAVGLGNLDLRSSARTGPGYHDEAWERGEREYPDVFVRWNTRRNVEYCLRLISEGKLDVKALTTHRFPLADIDQAVTAHLEHADETLGTVLVMGEGG